MKEITSVLVTGATGFIGLSLLKFLNMQENINVTGLCRVKNKDNLNSGKLKAIGNLELISDWSEILSGQDVVIHAAARVHAMKDKSVDPLSEYRKVNVAGSENLALQAAEAGVKRFIFISSVKVCGDSTTSGVKYDEHMKPVPEDDYGQSKYEAEEILKKVSILTGMELVVIRPPLVYGADVKGNFLNLMMLASKKIPLPFGLINNQRSMVYIENLIDFIALCIDHPKAANQVFLISDGEDVSLRSLVINMRCNLGIPHLLLPIPICLLKAIGNLTGKIKVIDRLVGNLQVDSSKAEILLGWEPPYTFPQGLNKTISAFKNEVV